MPLKDPKDRNNDWEQHKMPQKSVQAKRWTSISRENQETKSHRPPSIEDQTALQDHPEQCRRGQTQI
jgi:hypothetical protein